VDAKKELNDALAPLGLEASDIRPIDVGRDRWSQFLTTGLERDLSGQKAYITFCRKISDELELSFSAYFPRFEYAVSRYKTLYVMSNGKRYFDGIRGRSKNESIDGWVLTEDERAVFTKWYNDVTLRQESASSAECCSDESAVPHSE
jgi:hypothetical protein